MTEKKKNIVVQTDNLMDGAALFDRVSAIIENRKTRVQTLANQETVLMFWDIGKFIGSVLLGGERAEYGKQILVTLSQELQKKYGSSFEYSNVTRMVKFAARFPDFQILVPLAQQLSWSHFIALLPIKNDEALQAHYKLSRNIGNTLRVE